MQSLVICRARGVLLWSLNFNFNHKFIGRHSNSESISKKTAQQNLKMENRPQKQQQQQQKSITNDSSITSNPNFNKIQQIIHSSDSSSSDGWEKCWQLGLTPWDLGQPTPVMVHLHQAGALPKGRALVPGCGMTIDFVNSVAAKVELIAKSTSPQKVGGRLPIPFPNPAGHDVVAIACPERYVVGLDISDEAIKKAIELSSSLPNANYFTFLKEDFFTWRPTELFDLIFDYTFFCAIEPDMRSAWASQMRDLLKPDGELITIMFPVSDHVGGPPYKVSVADYEEFLNPIGFKAVSIVDNELAIAPRKWKYPNLKVNMDSQEILSFTWVDPMFVDPTKMGFLNLIRYWKREAWKVEEVNQPIIAVNVKEMLLLAVNT
ncbi:unnamed protein product [Camellia sinensis]